MDVEGLERLRLNALRTPMNLVLAKSCRNINRDREDVAALARGPGLDVEVLNQRYRDELRPKLGDRIEKTSPAALDRGSIEELRGVARPAGAGGGSAAASR